MMRKIIRCSCLMAFLFLNWNGLIAQTNNNSPLLVKKTKDFTLTGTGNTANWNNTEFVKLSKKDPGSLNYHSKFKILYSDSGIYCLYVSEDAKITSTLKEDFADLYNEDVVEAFFWPDEKSVIYFEYELSPTNYELPILVPNYIGKFLGWRPWHYENERKTRHATSIQKQGEQVQSWTAEFFIPYTLLNPLQNVPPISGMKWRANFYRIDYDQGNNYWTWQPTRLNFHDYEKFGTLIFE